MAIIRQPRMLLSSRGLTSAGKTFFALNGTPRPALLLDFDYGAEGLPAEVLEGVDIAQYDLLAGAFKGESEQARKQIIVAETERFLADYRKAIDSGQYRLVVVDTASVLWSGLRLRHETYADAEEVFLSLIRAAYKSHTTNLVLIHHMQTVWARSAEGKPYKKNGVFELVGGEFVESKVQLAVEHKFVAADRVMDTPSRWETHILKCRDNKPLEGEVLVDVDWQTLCTMAAPSVDWSL